MTPAEGSRVWLEAILSRDDLVRLLGRAFPVTVHSAENELSITFSDLASTVLVPDEGLRVVCKAHVHWPLLGIDIPILLHSVTVLLRPSISAEANDRLVFGITLEHVDVAGIPTVIDDRISHALDAKLANLRLDLGWNFAETLSYIFPLPKAIFPLRGFSLRAAWGKTRITEEAFVMVVSFHSDIVRGDEPLGASHIPPDTLAPAPVSERPRSLQSRTPDSGPLGFALMAFGLGASVALMALRGTSRWR